MKRIEWVNTEYADGSKERRLDIRLPFDIWVMIHFFDSFYVSYGACINFGDGFHMEAHCYPVTVIAYRVKK